MHYDTIKASIAENLDLPKEVVLDLPLMTITGTGEIIIDNFKNIREFSDNCVTVTTKDSRIIVGGCGLCISYLTKESVIIKGKLTYINFN